MSDPAEVLVTLLSGCLRTKRERYIEFAMRPKARGKLFAGFYHEFRDCLDDRVVTRELPEDAWLSPAYSYGPSVGFGTPWSSLHEAFAGMGEAQLLVTHDGRFGIFTEEDSFGGPVFIQVKKR